MAKFPPPFVTKLQWETMELRWPGIRNWAKDRDIDLETVKEVTIQTSWDGAGYIEMKTREEKSDGWVESTHHYPLPKGGEK